MYRFTSYTFKVDAYNVGEEHINTPEAVIIAYRSTLDLCGPDASDPPENVGLDPSLAAGGKRRFAVVRDAD